MIYITLEETQIRRSHAHAGIGLLTKSTETEDKISRLMYISPTPGRDVGCRSSRPEDWWQAGAKPSARAPADTSPDAGAARGVACMSRLGRSVGGRSTSSTAPCCSTQAAEEALPAGDKDLDGEGAAEARGAAAGVVQPSVETLRLAGLSDQGDGEEPDGGALAWHL
jgi:hypothetical protein